MWRTTNNPAKYAPAGMMAPSGPQPAARSDRRVATLGDTRLPPWTNILGRTLLPGAGLCRFLLVLGINGRAA